jgi:hypothetical protein
MIFAEIKNYLPKYLSPEAQGKLFTELRAFPSNIDARMFAPNLRKELAVFQGDGITDLPIVNLPNNKVVGAKCLVLSNTCDIDPQNRRLQTPHLSYCPMIRYSALSGLVVEIEKDAGKAESYLRSVRQQEISSMFFVPRGELLNEDFVALLDRTMSCPISPENYDAIAGQKLFTLSDYGFYMFLIKLSVHFTRINDGVSRN